MESVANVICRITFGKLFDSSHPDFQERLDINNRAFTDTELNSQVLMLDNFPIAKYFPFKAYQTEKEMTDRMFEILHNQIREQEKAFDPEAEISGLIRTIQKRILDSNNNALRYKKKTDLFVNCTLWFSVCDRLLTLLF